MSIKVNLLDGFGSASRAKISSRGQLVVAPLDFSSPYTATAAVNDTAYNIITAEPGKRFVITDILLDADKNVSNTTAGTVVLYEASAADATTVDTTILSIEMLKNTNRVITGLNLIVTEGKFVNIKTTDNSIYATILGYFVDA